jgi:hypothetical protein
MTVPDHFTHQKVMAETSDVKMRAWDALAVDNSVRELPEHQNAGRKGHLGSFRIP